VIDTGSNQNLSIPDNILKDFFGNQSKRAQQTLDERQRTLKSNNRGKYFNVPELQVFVLGTTIRKQGGTIELLPNPGKFGLLEFDDGIQVYLSPPGPPKDPKDDPRPQTPVLGMRAIRDNKVRFWTNGEKYGLGLPCRWPGCSWGSFGQAHRRS
jgi:hypothetical protein